MEPFSVLTGQVQHPPQSDPISDPSQYTAAEENNFGNALVVGITFNRWFIVTYQAAIIGVVVLAAAGNWHQNWRRSRRRPRRIAKARPSEHGEDNFPKQATTSISEEWSSNSSASSSTRTGDATPPDSSKGLYNTASESDALLPTDAPKRTSAPILQRARRWCKATLMYQPPPLPLLHRIVPENSTTLLVIYLLGLNIFYLFYHIDYSTYIAIDIIADRSALLFVANLPWLYLLAAKNQPLKALTGRSYENLNLLHRRQGELLCGLAAVHFVGMVFAWWHLLRPLGYSLFRFLTLKFIIPGDVAFVAYQTLYFTSLSSFREWWYEMFLATHVFLQAAALVLLFFHHFNSRPYVLASLAIFLLDRLVWRLGVKTKAFWADLEVMEDGETVKVSSNWPVSRKPTRFLRSWLGFSMNYGWESSQHVFLTVPGISKQHTLQFHPMTIASAAPEPGQEHAWFNLIIRAKGGFSRDLLRYAHDNPSTQIRLDGPYGSLHALEMLHASDVAIIVAGGSGIAVAYPMLWSLLRSEARHTQQICLIWIVQDASHVRWVGSERLEELKAMGLHVVIPPPSKKHGRPGVAALLCDSLHELVGRAESTELEPKIGVVVSGPDSLNRSVRNTCSRLVRREALDIDVAVEKFGW